MGENEDLQREREKLELERRRLELERERFAFEREKQSTNGPQPTVHATTRRRSVPIAMWIIGGAMLVSCFLPWVEMRGSWDWGVAGKGSMLFGNASGTQFPQGQLCVLLLVGAIVAKHYGQRAVSGACALIAPLLAIHFVLQAQGMLGHSQSVSIMGMTASSSLRADPSFGSIALVILSIPFIFLAFRRGAAIGAGGVVAPPTTAAANVPWPLVGMIAVQIGLVLAVIAMFNGSSRHTVPYVLLFSVLHLVISRRRNWHSAASWSTILVVLAALGWGLRLLLKHYGVLGYWDDQGTGSAVRHVALKFSDAFMTSLPTACMILVAIILILSWKEHTGREMKIVGAVAGGPRWRQVLIACCVALGYPTVISAVDAVKLNVPTDSELEQFSALFHELEAEEWIVFRSDAPSNTTSFKLAQTYDGNPSKVRISDYGIVSASLTMTWDDRVELSKDIEFNAEDAHIPDSLVFRGRNNIVHLASLRNNLVRVYVESPDPNDSHGMITSDYYACRASIYGRRQRTVRSVEDRLQAHCIFLSPRQEQDVPGEAIPTRASGSEVVAIAKEVLLAKDTVGVSSYRYEAIPSPVWVGLTDTTLTLDHQIRFVALSKDSSGESRSLRTYRSVFDTTGVLLASMEKERVRESATTYDSDSTYMVEGIFVNATCNEECYVTFRIKNGSISEERRLLYAVVAEKVPLMLNADGAGDFTNPALIGKSFMLMLKRTAQADEYAEPEAMPHWVESVVMVDPL